MVVAMDALLAAKLAILTVERLAFVAEFLMVVERVAAKAEM